MRIKMNLTSTELLRIIDILTRRIYILIRLLITCNFLMSWLRNMIFHPFGHKQIDISENMNAKRRIKKGENMKFNVKKLLTLLCCQLSLFSIDVMANTSDFSDVKSISGTVLPVIIPSESSMVNLEIARKEYLKNPMDPDAMIWLGRRIAYTGDYHGAIDIFTQGIKKFPEDARFYRHRGHRYISIRQLDNAISDLELASELMINTLNQIEPDGLPNLKNIPLTTTYGNIWYHLGLAHYLKQNWRESLKAFQNGYDLGGNDDNLVSTGHWIFMILSLMGEPEEAAKKLKEIRVDMNIIENMSYHQLCLLYKGEISIDQLLSANGDNPSSAAVAYGVANYFYYNGNKKKSDELLQNITQGSSWSAFGYIAAEIDLANKNR